MKKSTRFKVSPVQNEETAKKKKNRSNPRLENKLYAELSQYKVRIENTDIAIRAAIPTGINSVEYEIISLIVITFIVS